MAKTIDLTQLKKEETLDIILGNKEEFKLPERITNATLLNIKSKIDSMSKNISVEKKIKLQNELIADILNLDKSKNVDFKYVEENIYPDEVVIIIDAVIEHYSKYFSNLKK